jgi:tripartite-type tricarboxylate transporter receptor subunit TctC
MKAFWDDRRVILSRAGLAVLLMGALYTGPGSAAEEAPFYQGKTITIIEGRSPGGTGSLRTQAVVKYLQKYLPGNPPVAYQFMAGGGGIAAANHMVHGVKPDGLTIANIGVAFYSSAILGASGVRYRIDDFVSLGSAYSGGQRVLLIRADLGLDTVDKVRAYKGLRFGNRAVGHATYTYDRLFAYILDLKEPRWILGYDSLEIGPAILRGEADTQVQSVHTILRRNSEWLKSGFTFPVFVKDVTGKGLEAYPQFPRGIASLDRYADTELKRAVMQFYYGSNPGTSVFFAPKGLPQPALKALTEAFNKVWADRQLHEEYERLTGEPADPVTGEEVDRALQQISKDPKVMNTYKQLMAGGPLPPSK